MSAPLTPSQKNAISLRSTSITREILETVGVDDAIAVSATLSVSRERLSELIAQVDGLIELQGGAE